MAGMFDLLPDHELLLSLEPEDLAGVVLQYLNSLPHDKRGLLNRYNFSLSSNLGGYPPQQYQAIGRTFMEAWVWLEREGLIAPEPGSQGDWVFVTRRGQQMRQASDLKAYRDTGLLPRKLLHPTLVGKVVAPFVRGEYDTAVFQAFKEVEVAVRAKGSSRTPTSIPTSCERPSIRRPARYATPAWSTRSGKQQPISLRVPWVCSRTHTATGT